MFRCTNTVRKLTKTLENAKRVRAAHPEAALSMFILYNNSIVLNFTVYTVDATEYVTAKIDATFHEGRVKWRAVR